MSKTITGTTSYGNTATVPEDNVDLASATVVEAVFQRLLDNTRYLQQLAEATGVKLVRNVANLAALKAITGMADREVCWVEGLGLFFYDSAGATTADDVMVVEPTSGGGRWFHVAYAARGANYGFASIGSNGKVPAAQRPFYNKDQFFEGNPKVNVNGDVVETTILSDTLDLPIPSGAKIQFIAHLDLAGVVDYTAGGYSMNIKLKIDGSTVQTQSLAMADLDGTDRVLCLLFELTSGSTYSAGTALAITAQQDSGAAGDKAFFGYTRGILRVWEST